MSMEDTRARANRAELLVNWYLRFNGYLTLQNFILHRATRRRDTQRTDIDNMAVRFPFSREVLENRTIVDDDRILDVDARRDKLIDFVIAEVKSGYGSLNRVWGEPTPDRLKSVEYILRRMGFIENEAEIAVAARSLHGERRLRVDPHYLVRVVGFARERGSLKKEPTVQFISFSDIARFIHGRQWSVPSDHDQWAPEIIGIWAAARRLKDQEQEFVTAVQRWIRSGSLKAMPTS